MASNPSTEAPASSERVTQAELARRLGVSRQDIHQLIARGLLTKGDDNLLDFAQAQAELAANLKKVDSEILNTLAGQSPNAALEASPEEPSAIFAARLRIMEADAAQREIKLATTRGELIDRAGTERAAMSVARVLRDSLIDIFPGKISHSLAVLTDPYSIECTIKDAIRLELREICARLETEAAAS